MGPDGDAVLPPHRKTFEAPVVDDLPSLVWAVDLTTVEFHRVLARITDLASPTAVLLDLDPGSPAGLLEPRRAGLLRDAELDVLWLPAYANTSGGRGRGSEDSLRTRPDQREAQQDSGGRALVGLPGPAVDPAAPDDPPASPARLGPGTYASTEPCVQGGLLCGADCQSA